jgi:hypothetical protein
MERCVQRGIHPDDLKLALSAPTVTHPEPNKPDLRFQSHGDFWVLVNPTMRVIVTVGFTRADKHEAEVIADERRAQALARYAPPAERKVVARRVPKPRPRMVRDPLAAVPPQMRAKVQKMMEMTGSTRVKVTGTRVELLD